MLHVSLLGEVDVRYGGERLHGLESPRLQSLLAYLLLHREAPQARQRIAFLLWPDSTEAQARTNLRQLLHHLRRALPDAEWFLEVTSKTVQWRADAPVSLDVTRFELAAERAARTEGEAEREALEGATALYGGDLLPGCYEEWVIPERERLRQRNLEILERLAASLEEAGDYPAAIRYGEMLLRNDPLHEATYRRLMRLHSGGGERARALRVYHTCATVLERELGVEPGPLTRGVYADLLALESAPAPTLQAPATSFAAAFVGRQAEWERSVAAWQEARGGRAQLLLVTGEAGLGKTRLVEELERWCNHQETATARTRAYDAEGALPYAPVVEWLRSEAVKPSLAKLEPVWMTEVARLLPELLSQHPGLLRPEPLTGAEQRQHLFEALARALVGAQPILLVLDDLQWCDQETLEFLHYLVRFDPRASVLVAVTARPEEIGPGHAATALVGGLHGIERVVEIALGPLDRPDVAALAEQLGEESVSPDLAEWLYRETEGNPLFVVETVRAGLLTGVEDRRPRTKSGIPVPEGRPTLPPKVQSVIQGRLNRLSPAAAELVALAATVGREFTYEVLARASEHDEDTLVTELDELWRRRIVREHGLHAYDFSHDKVREVAYAWVGPARRRRLHLAVASALQALHAGNVEPVSGQLAVHYDRAGQPEQAIPHYRRAAEVAQLVFANEEVVVNLTRALELLEQLPPGVARDEEELTLRVALGAPLVAVRGYGAPATLDNYARADDLCSRLGRPSSPAVLRGLALGSNAVGEFDRSVELGHRILRLAEGDGDPRLAVEGHYVLGVTTFWRGEFGASRDHLEQAIARYHPDDHRAHVALFAQDPKVTCVSRLALTLWYLGRPDDSARAIEESLALGEALAHPFSRAYALFCAVWLAGERRETERTEELARELASLCAEGGLATFGVLAEGWLGGAEASSGRLEAGVARIALALSKIVATGQTWLRPYLLSLLAQGLSRGGQCQGALRALREALEETERTGARYLEAELHRLRGELLLAEGGGANAREAEDALRGAIDVAHRQGAKLLELRSAVSLARWRMSSGPPERAAEARRVLEQLAAAFPEGSRIADLEEARELLHLPH